MSELWRRPVPDQVYGDEELRHWKLVARSVGFISLAAGLSLLPLSLCWLSISWQSEWGGTPQPFGLLWVSIEIVLLIGGYLLLTHANRSLSGQASRPLRLLPAWVFAYGLVLLLVLGEMVRPTPAGLLIFPLVFFPAALLPPLAALSWALHGRPQGLTWRQFIIAFLSGGTASAALALFLEILLPGLFVALVQGLSEIIRQAWVELVEALAGGEVARALSAEGFWLGVVALVLVAPLVEELCKPLGVLPLLRRAGSPRQAFLIGAAAGAGFAAMENLIYTGFAAEAWGGVLAVRAIGAAVHPLGSGLVAMAWHQYFHPGPGQAGIQGERLSSHHTAWLSRFGLAVGLHALWNGGSLLLIALGAAQFFGPAPAEAGVLGYSLLGVLLALLLVVGAAALAGLRAIARPDGEAPGASAEPAWTGDRSIAIWAVLCLIAILPLGLAALSLLGGGP